MISPFGPSPFPGRGCGGIKWMCRIQAGRGYISHQGTDLPKKRHYSHHFLKNSGVTFQSAKVSTPSEWNEMNPNSVVLHAAPPTTKENWNLLAWFPKTCPFALCVNNPPVKPFSVKLYRGNCGKQYEGPSPFHQNNSPYNRTNFPNFTPFIHNSLFICSIQNIILFNAMLCNMLITNYTSFQS